jgi:hypothetical protein
MVALALPLMNTRAMNTKITTALALLAGFVGGAMSHYLMVPMPVRAQGPVQSSPEIRAQKFVLVDENGTTRGVFGFQNDGTPAIQVNFGKSKGLFKLIGDGVGSARWLGVDKKNILPDLRPTAPHKANTPGSSE